MLMLHFSVYCALFFLVRFREWKHRSLLTRLRRHFHPRKWIAPEKWKEWGVVNSKIEPSFVFMLLQIEPLLSRMSCTEIINGVYCLWIPRHANFRLVCLALLNFPLNKTYRSWLPWGLHRWLIRRMRGWLHWWLLTRLTWRTSWIWRRLLWWLCGRLSGWLPARLWTRLPCRLSTRLWTGLIRWLIGGICGTNAT